MPRTEVNAVTAGSRCLSGHGVTHGTVFLGFTKNHFARNVVSGCLGAGRGSPGTGRLAGTGLLGDGVHPGWMRVHGRKMV